MWTQIANIYYQEKSSTEQKLVSILEDFGCNPEESEKRLKNQETKTFESLKLAVKDKVANIDLLMYQKFSTQFEVDKDGIPRRWQPNDDIKGIWTLAKLDAEKLIDLFSVIRLTEEEFPLKFIKTTSTGIEVVVDLPQVPEQQILIQPKEAERYLQRFRDQATTAYHSALKEMERVASQGNIPKYLLVLLLILGANEMWMVLQMIIFNPFLLFFSILLLCCAFVVWRLNLTPILKQMFLVMVSTGSSQISDSISSTLKPTLASAKRSFTEGHKPTAPEFDNKPKATRSYTSIPTMRSASPDESKPKGD